MAELEKANPYRCKNSWPQTPRHDRCRTRKAADRDKRSAIDKVSSYRKATPKSVGVEELHHR